MLQLPQRTTVWACEKTVVMLKQPGHFTSYEGLAGRVLDGGWVANHEKGVWSLDEFLELVFACFGRGSGIQEILSENLRISRAMDSSQQLGGGGCVP